MIGVKSNFQICYRGCERDVMASKRVNSQGGGSELMWGSDEEAFCFGELFTWKKLSVEYRPLKKGFRSANESGTFQ